MPGAAPSNCEGRGSCPTGTSRGLPPERLHTQHLHARRRGHRGFLCWLHCGITLEQAGEGRLFRSSSGILIVGRRLPGLQQGWPSRRPQSVPGGGKLQHAHPICQDESLAEHDLLLRVMPSRAQGNPEPLYRQGAVRSAGHVRPQPGGRSRAQDTAGKSHIPDTPGKEWVPADPNDLDEGISKANRRHLQ